MKQKFQNYYLNYVRRRVMRNALTLAALIFLNRVYAQEDKEEGKDVEASKNKEEPKEEPKEDKEEPKEDKEEPKEDKEKGDENSPVKVGEDDQDCKDSSEAKEKTEEFKKQQEKKEASKKAACKYKKDLDEQAKKEQENLDEAIEEAEKKPAVCLNCYGLEGKTTEKEETTCTCTKADCLKKFNAKTNCELPEECKNPDGSLNECGCVPHEGPLPYEEPKCISD